MKLRLLKEVDGVAYAASPDGQFYTHLNGYWEPVDEVPRGVFARGYAYWNRETIIAAIQEFARRYGRPPVATDWNVAYARSRGLHSKVVRFYEDGCYPHSNTVYGIPNGVFPTWADAIEAAGFRRPQPGRYETETRSYYAKPAEQKSCVDCGAPTSGRRCRRCHCSYASRVHWAAVHNTGTSRDASV